MKRTPMKRGTPLKRTPMKRTGMKRSRPMSRSTPKSSAVPPLKSKKRKSPKRKTKYASRERDIDYMLWVKTLPCLIASLEGAGPCSSVVEPDHVGVRGIGQKAPDDTCVPLCSTHHLDRHAHTGYFRYRSKEWTREWREEAIRKTQAEHQRCGGRVIDAIF